MDEIDLFIFFGLITVGFFVGALVFFPLGQRSILRMKARRDDERSFEILDAEIVEERAR